MIINILMIDDHPLQIEGYKSILSFNDMGHELQITEAYNCKDAYNIIIADPDFGFDMVFLDRSMPPYPEKKIQSGEDLAHLIKKQWPDAVLVILTSHCEAFILYNIIKKINPEGLLVKSDVGGEELLVAFKKLLNGEKYYSTTVDESKREELLREGHLDSIDRQIIMFLSRGYKTESISEELHITKSAIDKRKAKIKDHLGLDKGNDEQIVKECRKLGFI